MIARRVAANHEHTISLFKIFERNRCSASAYTRLQTDATGLVAVIAAVVNVIGPVQARQQLQQEASFFATTSAEVPERFVRGD